MHDKYPRVFSPIRLGPVELRNRFYSSPYTMPFAFGGKPTDDYVRYNVERARGGLGLLMVSVIVPERAKAPAGPGSPNTRETIPAFRVLTDAVHAEGARIFAEPFYHWCGPGSWLPFSPPAPMLGASPAHLNFLDRRSTTREMTRREIAMMLRAFGNAVGNLREAGFDGIMLHVSHAALLEQFLSPYYNRRTDEYGGNLENRMRLLVEMLETVRAAAGDGMAVGMRLNCNEFVAGGLAPADSREVLKRIVEAGLIDFVDLDVALEPDQLYLGMPPVFAEPHVYRPHVEAVRAAAGAVPVLSVMGRLTSVADGEAILASGACDMVGAARALIAEPELVRNALEGREERSRTCIACNMCLAGIYEGMLGCAINPASYRERHWGVDSFVPAPLLSKVVVVGGGPAGLEAARVGALRGHRVTLCEARDRLGGALALWADLPGRAFYRKAVDWWERELARLGVEVRLGAAASAADILARAPDAVILATGAAYARGGESGFCNNPVPGHDQPFVLTPEQVLMGEARPSGRILVIDAEGIQTGPGIAEALAAAGNEVELISPYFSPMSPRLVEGQDAHFIVQRLNAAGVRVSPTTFVRRIADREVVLYDVNSQVERVVAAVDAVILATGRVAVNGLERELDGEVRQLYVIGDALAPRLWSAATVEAHQFARLIGEPDAPATFADAYFGPDNPVWMPLPADMPRGLVTA